MATLLNKVLIVEDDPMILKSLAYLMELEGYLVETATNGLEALEVLRKGVHPCFILLDLMMPVMDGTEFLKEMQKEPLYSGIPVVVLSGDNNLKKKTSQFPIVTENILKPVDFEQIIELARRYC